MKTRSCLPLLTALACTGCAVYVPTVPTTPLLRQQGAVEVTAGLRGTSSLEAGAAWLPIGRLLVAAETALQRSEISSTQNNAPVTYRNYNRQLGLGLGTYWLLGAPKKHFLTAIAGMGVASVSVYDPEIAKAVAIILLPLPAIQPVEYGVQYRGHYRRYYGQLYWAARQERLSYGFSVRGTLVDY